MGKKGARLLSIEIPNIQEGGQFGGQFVPAKYGINQVRMSEGNGTDARFPSRVRQFVGCEITV